jgi:hypothetical protein
MQLSSGAGCTKISHSRGKVITSYARQHAPQQERLERVELTDPTGWIQNCTTIKKKVDSRASYCCLSAIRKSSVPFVL